MLALRARLLADGLADEATLAGIEAEARTTFDDASESPYPDVAELGPDVYREEVAV
ncbi:hypothetical protein [Frankia sp. CcI49]|uniref:hypothetical protein n=1 Tax=Frankia sp. CcI49 TaxID=1745382 RepID=UPI00130443B0|nr:hypothetical protein [Frankia sp. CcI49]